MKKSTFNPAKDFLAAAESQRREIVFRLKAGNTINRKTAIPHVELHNLLVDALEDKRIEPYQACLMLAANARLPFKLNDVRFSKWDHYLQALVSLHNDTSIDFVEKRRVILDSLTDAWITTLKRVNDRFRANPDNPDDPNHIDSDREILFDKRDGVPHDRIPKLANPQKRKDAAIPKDIFLPALKKSIAAGHMAIEQACVMLAINVHSLQRRKNKPVRYLDHVFAVASDPTLTPQQRMVAILHDVIEDSDWTAEDLKEVGFGNRLITSLLHLTKSKDEKVYLKFIERASLDPDALAVKMADIRHNMSDLDENNPNDALRLARYKWALLYLENVQSNKIEPGSSIRDFIASHGPYNSNLFRAENKNGKGYLEFLETAVKLPESFDAEMSDIHAKLSILNPKKPEHRVAISCCKWGRLYLEAIQENVIEAGTSIRQFIYNQQQPCNPEIFLLKNTDFVFKQKNTVQVERAKPGFAPTF